MNACCTRILSGFVVAALAVPSVATVANATEIRVGGYYHGLRVAAPHAREDAGLDYNAEILFDSPAFLSWLGSPRPQLGTTIAKHGTSLTYAGLDWTVNVTDAVFFDFGLGGAVHDGRLSGTSPNNNENRYGCRVLFHQNISIGYRITQDVSVMGTIEHMSNASLCDYNEGLTNAGVRLGYSF
ncbi:MAG: acyloxyacyl hydrolase [Parvibaculum sp.]|nr:acyloxyacyl hydrolase [Parvibaculum sp.]|tara:strand:+ start:15094 stop:15642 length:549 start_codon:yes stop_codon:yes gene_type:complete